MIPLEAAPRPIPDGTFIGHVHLKASDLSKIHDFYVGILGFNVTAKMPGALFLSAGGYHHHLAFNTWQSKAGLRPDPRMTGLYHIAINYPSRAALADALRRLAEAHYPIEGSSDHGTHEAIYLSDPEGNGLEIAWDRPQSEWPVDAEGRVDMKLDPLDLQGLLAVEMATN